MPKILLVEDNELNRDMPSRRLARKGYEVVLAGDGAEGVAAATAGRPDLVLMDMTLPGLAGRAARGRRRRRAGGFSSSWAGACRCWTAGRRRGGSRRRRRPGPSR